MKEKGFAQILIILILFVGLGAGFYLVRHDTNIFSKANDTPSQEKIAGDLSDQQKLKTLKVAVILFKLKDSPSLRFSKDDYTKLVFGPSNSVRSFYKEASFNQLNIAGQVFGWYTIPFESQKDCPEDIYKQAAIKAAAKDKYNSQIYDKTIFVMPIRKTFSGGCEGGHANILGGKEVLTVWGEGNITPYTFIHEIGHTLGIAHANSLLCRSKAIDDYSRCEEREYGDIYSMMGRGFHHFNITHKIALGWIRGSRIKSIDSSGTYDISPLETGSGIIGLKIPKANTNESYYLEYRQPIGWDMPLERELNIYRGITEGATILVWDGKTSSPSKTLDANPEPEIPWFAPETRIENAALKDNISFIDSLNGVTIKQVKHDIRSVTVEVTLAKVPTPVPEVGIKAEPSCTSPHDSYGKHIDLILRFYIPSSRIPKGNGVWVTITDTKSGSFVYYIYSDFSNPKYEAVIHDSIFSSRGGNVMKFQGDNREYQVKAYAAPFTEGEPTLNNLLGQSSFSVLCQ